MRTAILGAVAGLGLTAGAASAHPPGWGGGWGGYAPVVVRPAPVVVPASGFSIGFGGWNGGFQFNSFNGGFYRPAYGWGGYPGWGYGGYRPGFYSPGWGGYGYGRPIYRGW